MLPLLEHLVNGLLDERVDAVATAHLFNFVGDSAKGPNDSVRLQDVGLAKWPPLSELGQISL